MRRLVHFLSHFGRFGPAIKGFATLGIHTPWIPNCPFDSFLSASLFTTNIQSGAFAYKIEMLPESPL
jgi:hypothetical protein